ncbi:hypothetical protein J7E70_02040 [Variovorax paradoxus]|nr:hypothetical protein [Variovorax paradoxus]MBT2299235.1 hypothetical protein [Variovorax paradoxus]
MRWLFNNWEALLTSALFLISVYGAVYLVRIGALGWAGMAVCCAFGFFQALQAFVFAADWSERVRRQQGAEGLDG